MLEKLDSVWHHVVGEPDDAACKGWLRHVLRRRATRPERCPTSEKWRVFQGARFVGQAPLERCDGNLGGAPLPLSLGMVHSTLGAGASLALGVDTSDDAELIRADAARFAECVIADPRLRREYRRRRDAAAGRFAINVLTTPAESRERPR